MSTITSSATQAAAATSTTKSTIARETLTGNFQDFLTLFVTQLKHQDPLEPMESSEFTNSLANLSSVEQAVNMNSNLEKLIGMFESNQVTDSASYIDKTVEFDSSQFELKNGKAQFSYILDENSQGTPIAITDDKGNLVLQTEGSKLAGKHGFLWDGKDANGNQMPDGVYSLTVGAENKSGDIANVKTTGTGTVTGVSFEAGKTIVEVLNVGISMEDILSIRSNQI